MTRKNSLWIYLILLTLCLTTLAVAAGPDPLTGIRISLLGVETVLSSPPLPDLNTNAKGHFNLAGGYMTASVNSSDTTPAGVSTANGSFRGGSAAIGYSTASNTRLGYFVFATANTVSGKIDLVESGFTLSLANMKNSGYSITGGSSFRVWSAEHFPMSFGIFGGPTASYYTSHFDVNNAQTGSFDASPLSYGGMLGAQVGMKIFSIYLNPYFIYYKDLTDGCRGFTSTRQIQSNGPQECPEGALYIKVPMSFATYGLNVGFGNFYFTVYSHFGKDPSMDMINLHDYQLSYSVDL